jgi:co-chaperonin GroES (HSP10)|tara:strand:+ start:91 stop:348 length:258 start_codon:yes stop_codon:yes gene_type:complete
MKPIGKYIVITEVKEEMKTSSGLLLSNEDAGKMRYKRGLVVAPGTDVTVIGVDDEIYFDKGSGFTMLIEDNPYTIILERDVVIVL